MRFGSHMSVAGGIDRAFVRAEEAGCECLQIFLKNSNQWQAPAYTDEQIAAYKAEEARTGIFPVTAHDSYLINLASPDNASWEKSLDAFADEMLRAEVLGVPYLIMHPGAHVGSGEEAGIRRLIQAFNRLVEEVPAPSVHILIETTAGQGSTLGYRFEHLRDTFAGVERLERFGVCMDTCHLLAAGYDLKTLEGWAETMASFERLVGLDKLRAFHLNDSSKDLGSRVDRHDHIGQGCIGLEGFRAIVNDPRLKGLPGILETPKEDDMDRKNLAVLRGLVEV